MECTNFYLLAKAKEVYANKIISFLIGFSGLLIFFAWDESFNMQVLTPLVFIVFLYYFINSRFEIKIDKNLILILSLLAIYCFSLISSSIIEPQSISYSSILRIVYMAVILLYYVILIKMNYSKENIKMILFGNVVSGFIIALMIIFNYLTGSVGKISVISIWGNSVEENYTGSFIAFCAMISLVWMMYDRSFLKKLLLFIGFICMFLGICLTGCRAAIISVVISVSFASLKFIFDKNVSFLKKMVFIVVISLSVFLFFRYAINFFPSNIYERLVSITNGGLKDSSNEGRVELWEFGLKGVLYRPLFGYGIGNYNYYVLQIPKFSHHTVVVAHSTWIDFLVDGGFIGFALVIMLFFRNMKHLLKRDNLILLSLLICWIFCSFIVGGERTFFFWNSAIILSLLSLYMNKTECTIKDIIC